MDVGICKLEGEVPAVRGVGRNGRLYVRIWWQVGWSEDRARVISEIEANEANLCGRAVKLKKEATKSAWY
jgi:hypothetical protein